MKRTSKLLDRLDAENDGAPGANPLTPEREGEK
jgi:hypothetical protein